MTLGSRHIAIVRHSDPNAPNPNEWIIRRLWKDAGEFFSERRPWGCDCGENHVVRFLIVELDELRDPDGTDDAEYQRVERQLLFFTAEEERLRPAAKAKLEEAPAVPEPVRMRAVIEAMRPIVDAAPRALTPAEWSSLFETRIWALGEGDVPLTPAERGYLASAIDKLREFAYANSDAAKVLR